MFYLGKVIGKSNKASQQVKYEEEKDIRLKQTNKKNDEQPGTVT